MRPYLGRLIAASVLLALAGALMSAALAVLKPLADDVLQLGGGAAPSAAASAPAAPDVVGTVKRALGLDRALGWARNRAYVEVPLLLLCVFLARAVLLYFGQYHVLKCGTSVIRDIRADLQAAISSQSLRFFQAHPTGEILSRVLSDVARLQRVSTDVLADFIRVGAGVPFILVLVLWQDLRLSLLALVTVPAVAYPMVLLGKRLRRAATRSQETLAEAASLLSETVTGAKVVQSFAMERFEIGRFRQALGRMWRADLKAARAVALAPAVMELFGGLVGGWLFFLAGREVAKGRLTGGEVMVVFGGLGYLFMSVRKMNALNTEIQQAIAAAKRVFGMMDRESEIRDLPGAEPLPPFRESVAFEGVDFAYEKETVLGPIDLRIPRGQMVALVGASGSGKSTLANLVPRFYDPTSGCLRIDGRDVRTVTLASLRQQIGLVTQETVLFNDTVRNNIAYGRTDVSLDRVQAAARAAHADEFIRALPEGYDTVIGERGARLSMGQRQRITIARALLKDPPILILDEATSALDSESESMVQAALDELMKGRTSLVIAHRLATVRRADRILVMEAGRIVEEGDHRSLLERGGVYARLHALQFRNDTP
jgi:subfamily B ATP-binding cassette protein MsbA